MTAKQGYEEALASEPSLRELLGSTGIEDHEAVHEVVKARLQASPRL